MTFEIEAASIADCVIAPIPDQTVTGQALKPALEVSNASGGRLAAGTDYMAVYHANVEIGTAHVALVGKGNYFGVKTATFQIVAGSIADAEVTGVAARYFYTGEAVAVEPAVCHLHDGALPVPYVSRITAFSLALREYIPSAPHFIED